MKNRITSSGLLAKTMFGIALSAMIFTGCKKDEAPGGGGKDLVRTVTNGNHTTTFTYDGDENLASIGGNTSFSWSKNSLLVDAGGLSGNYTRNEKGYIASRVSGSLITYSYDSKNRLVSYQINGSTITFNWDNDNHIASVGVDAGLTNEYYADKKDNRNYGLQYAPYLDMIIRNEGYSALPSKNLLKRSNDDEYSYEFDDKGRISKMTITSPIGTPKVYTYTYY